MHRPEASLYAHCTPTPLAAVDPVSEKLLATAAQAAVIGFDVADPGRRSGAPGDPRRRRPPVAKGVIGATLEAFDGDLAESSSSVEPSTDSCTTTRLRARPATSARCSCRTRSVS